MKNIKTVKKEIKLKNIKTYLDKFGLLDVGDSLELNAAFLETFKTMTTKQLAAVAWLASRAFSGGYRSCLENGRAAFESDLLVLKQKRGAK